VSTEAEIYAANWLLRLNLALQIGSAGCDRGRPIHTCQPPRLDELPTRRICVELFVPKPDLKLLPHWSGGAGSLRGNW